VDELISDIQSDPKDAPRALARDLCTLAGWYHLLRDVKKREVALNLAAELLSEQAAESPLQNWA
jgi:hypothetical protein